MSKKTLTVYEFEEFRLDAENKCLWHGDELVSLTPKALDTLLVLIRQRGEIVSKDALLDEVWADTFVEESTLSQNILTLRKTLAAFAKDQKFIATVPRRGYRFVGDVREIVGDEDFFIVERRTRTRIVAEQIHDSLEAVKDESPARPKRPQVASKYLFLGGILLGVLVVSVAVWKFFLTSPRLADTKFRQFALENIFSSASIQQAVISPNGKYLALVERHNGVQKLVVRQITEANSLEIVPQIEGQFIGFAFAPASDYVFYAAYPKKAPDQRRGELYKVPVLGGLPQKIAEDIDSPPAVSADGQKIAFVRRKPDEKETWLMMTDANGRNERQLALRKFGEGFQNAAFSPDGKYVSSAAFSRALPSKNMEIVVVETETGEQKLLSPPDLTWIGQTVWLNDSSGLAFIAYPSNSPNLTDEVWFVSFPEGKARLLENGVSGIFGLSMTQDSDSIVTVKSNKITSFAISPLENFSLQTTLLTKTGDESLVLPTADWTADDRIVYSTVNNGHLDLWTINADGRGQKQLTSDQRADYAPQVAPDRQTVYFLSNRTGISSIWRMNADGRNAQPLTADQEIYAISLAPDGREIFYMARGENIYTLRLWKISADGQNARQLTDKPTLFPKISPDGQQVACFYPDAAGNLKLSLLSAENGALLKQFELSASEHPSVFAWDADGRSLLVSVRQGNSSTLWRQSINGEAVKLNEWPNEIVFRLLVSKDGQRIFYEKGVTANNVLLLRDKK